MTNKKTDAKKQSEADKKVVLQTCTGLVKAGYGFLHEFSDSVQVATSFLVRTNWPKTGYPEMGFHRCGATFISDFSSKWKYTLEISKHSGVYRDLPGREQSSHGLTVLPF